MVVASRLCTRRLPHALALTDFKRTCAQACPLGFAVWTWPDCLLTASVSVCIRWQDLGALAAFGRAMRTKTFTTGHSQHVANSVYGIALLEPTTSELVGCRTAYN